MLLVMASPQKLDLHLLVMGDVRNAWLKNCVLSSAKKKKQSKVEAVGSGNLWSGQPSVYTEINLL